MRLAFMGKGGSGKSTFCAAFIQYLSDKKSDVFAVDADVNMHLGQLLEMNTPPSLGDYYTELQEYLFSERKIPLSDIPEVGCIPPSLDSKFIYYEADDPIIRKFTTSKNSLRLMQVGTFDSSEVGTWCFHGRLRSLELFLHYLLEPDETPVVIDLNAGVDSITSSLCFIATTSIFLVEPTLKSINVYKQYKELIKDLLQQKDVSLKVIVNKTYTKEDEKFVQKYIDESEILGYASFNPIIGQQTKKSLETCLTQNKEIFIKIEKLITNAPQDRSRSLELLRKHFTHKLNNLEITKKFTNNDFSYEKVLLRTEDYFTRCYFGPIDEYKKRVFTFAMPKIKGDVFEIGAGEMPWYWALGYIHQIQSVVFSEYSEKLLENYKNFIAQFNPEHLSEELQSTLTFLKKQDLAPDIHIQGFFEEILKKSDTLAFDFLKPKKVQKQFDTVIGFEAMEIVNTKEELAKVMQTTHALLKKGGMFVGTTFPYHHKDHFVKRLIANKLEGRLNPNKDIITKAARDAGFTNISIQEISTKKRTYPEALFITFQK